MSVPKHVCHNSAGAGTVRSCTAVRQTGKAKAAVTIDMTAPNADLTYTAVDDGYDGNDINVAHLAPQGDGELAVTVLDRAIAIALAASGAVASSATIGGIIYTAKVPGTGGDNISVTHVHGVHDQAIGVRVTGTDIVVTLGISATVKATRTIGGIVFTAVLAGVLGNDITVEMLKSGQLTPLSVVVTGDAIAITLQTDAGVAASRTIGGVVYTAKAVGTDGNSIRVRHLVSGNSTPLTCTVSTLDITVNLATSAGVKALAAIGGLTYTAQVAGVAGDSITVTHVVSGTSTSLSCTVDGTGITVNLATDGDGLVTSVAADVISIIAATPAAIALVVASGTGAPVAATATALASGADGTATSSAAAVAAKVAETTAAAALVVASGSGTPAAAGYTALQSGAAGAVISTAADIIALLAEDDDASALVVASGTGTPAAAGATNLQSGSDGNVASTYAQVIAKIADEPTSAALVVASGTGTPVAATKTQLASGAAGTISTVASEVKALINADADASALVLCEDESTGSGLVNAVESTNLAGGVWMGCGLYDTVLEECSQVLAARRTARGSDELNLPDDVK